MTSIEWTRGDDGSEGKTWNPTTGCDRVSPGCDHCYALTLAKRLKGMGSAKYQTDGDPRTSGPGFGLAVHPDTLRLPLTWRKPQRVFVNSMSDLFHDSVPTAFIAQVFDVMRRTPQHTYQILTKRHARLRALGRTATFGEGWPLPNVWLGVSVENQQWADIRIPALLETPAAVRFLSCEPLLGPLNLKPWLPVVRGQFCEPHWSWLCGASSSGGRCQQERLSWVIAGGESGPNFRSMHPDWPRWLAEQCQATGVAYFFKQWGGRTPKAGGRVLDGRTWDEFPAAAEAVPA